MIFEAASWWEIAIEAIVGRHRQDFLRISRIHKCHQLVVCSDMQWWSVVDTLNLFFFWALQSIQAHHSDSKWANLGYFTSINVSIFSPILYLECWEQPRASGINKSHCISLLIFLYSKSTRPGESTVYNLHTYNIYNIIYIYNTHKYIYTYMAE